MHRSAHRTRSAARPSAMISPKPVAIASIVPVKPTPEAKPRSSEARSNEMDRVDFAPDAQTDG